MGIFFCSDCWGNSEFCGVYLCASSSRDAARGIEYNCQVKKKKNLNYVISIGCSNFGILLEDEPNWIIGSKVDFS